MSTNRGVSTAAYVPRVSAFRCGGGQLRDPIYNTQYNWFASGQPTVYPFLDEDGGDIQGKDFGLTE